MKIKGVKKMRKRKGILRSTFAKHLSIVALFTVMICSTMINSTSKIPITCIVVAELWLAVYMAANGSFDWIEVGEKSDEN